MSPSIRRFVAYYRVSTARQGRSGLGLEAQKAAVLAFINGNAELVAEFTEVESGKHAEREELRKAIAACKKHKAKLVIAKLDRLSRNLAFIATLMESGVEFVAVDMPEANKLTVHILAAMAEHEREQISKRTKDALAAAKRRGKRLGNPDIAEVAKRGRAALKANARRFAANVRPIIEEIVPRLPGIAVATHGHRDRFQFVTSAARAALSRISISGKHNMMKLPRPNFLHWRPFPSNDSERCDHPMDCTIAAGGYDFSGKTGTTDP